jgi:hypothetical protein
MIAQMWIVLFPGSLQMVLEPLSNVRSYSTGALHDVALTRMLGIEEGGVSNTPVPYWEEDEKKLI